ncbi:MAG: hypothetical protein KC468_29795 [Myxococcales bacterium]|nr:hypothetical protein [Myxococcales bacterium]
MPHARSLLPRVLPSLALGAALAVLGACGDTSSGSDASSDGPASDSDDTSNPSGGPDADSGATAETLDPGETTGADDQLPPTNSGELRPWLDDGGYLGWTAESAPHDSAGPHFGTVRTYVNQALLDSLDAQDATHPQGAAAVKELYGDGDAVLGWSVAIKTQADSAMGDGWYWYEVYNGSVFGDGLGDGTCTGCHGGGLDYVLTPYPLQ